MKFILYPAQSDADLAYFNEEEYQSALENEILMDDRSAEDARETYLADLANYMENLKNNQIIIAATPEGEYAGMIWLAERTSNEPWDFSALPAWIYDIRVRPEFRGNGLGHLLLKEAEKWAAACGLGEIGLHVFGKNTIAINLYQANCYRVVYSYRQKDLPAKKFSDLERKLSFRKYDPDRDKEFTHNLLYQQYSERAKANPALSLTEGEISSGFTHCLEIYNFGNEKKELIITEAADGAPTGILWFYRSKGDLGKRRYIWLHSALARNPEDLPQMLLFLENWAAENQMEAIRTPLHTCEEGLSKTLEAFNYQPANLFMLKNIKT